MRRRGSRYQPITGGAEMFARLQTVAARPTDEELVPMIADMVSGHPGFAGLALLAGDDSSGGLVSLWLTREDAELASERSVAIRGPRPFELTRDEIYEVDADEPGSAAGEEPAVAFLGEFDGPLSPARGCARFPAWCGCWCSGTRPNAAWRCCTWPRRLRRWRP